MREIATNCYAAEITLDQDGNFCRDGGNFGRNPYSREKICPRSIDDRLSCYGLVYLFPESTQGLQKDGFHALTNTIESTDRNDRCVVLDNRMRK